MSLGKVVKISPQSESPIHGREQTNVSDKQRTYKEMFQCNCQDQQTVVS